jgi:hypothetical protein
MSRCQGCSYKKAVSLVPFVTSPPCFACEGAEPSQLSSSMPVSSLKKFLGVRRAYFAGLQCAAVTRLDWLRNAAGLRQVEYWTGKLQPRPTVDWCAAFEVVFRP